MSFITTRANLNKDMLLALAITPIDMMTNEAISHFKILNNEYVITEYLYSYLNQFNYDLLGNTSSIATAINSKIIKKYLL